MADEIRSKIASLKVNLIEDVYDEEQKAIEDDTKKWFNIVFYIDKTTVESAPFFTTRKEISLFDEKYPVIKSEEMNPQPVAIPNETSLLLEEFKEKKVRQLEMF